MSNVAGKAYAMNVVTPMRPALTWINRLAFMVSRAFPSSLQGLLGLGLIHFARWVIIRRDQWPQRGQPPQDLVNDYMLFVSNFNGTWDQYIDAFADGLPSGLDVLWYSSTKFPHSIPITPFKNYIRANQIDTGYYYNATPGSAQRDIKAALTLISGLRAIDAGSLEDGELGAAYDALLLTMQGGLGTPGYAPIASCDTTFAERHRSVAVRERWGGDAKGPPAAERLLHAVAPAVVRGAAGNEDEKQAVRQAVDASVASPSRVHEAPVLTLPPPSMTSPSPPASVRSRKPGLNIDAGHYFFTALVPVCNDGIVAHDPVEGSMASMKSSPIHLVREALETLPTALQSHATEDTGIQSPFAKNMQTHFARFTVLDRPNYNGRDPENAIVEAVTGTDLLTPQHQDALSCPYIVVSIDFDPANASGEGEPRAYLEELWSQMPVALTAVFRYCYGFGEVTDAASFADFMLPCQVDTTMPFNDYWTGTPPLKSPSKLLLAAVPVLGLVLPFLLNWRWPMGSWWLTAGIAVVMAIVGILLDLAFVNWKGSQPFPGNPDATLPHILKGLYLQQALTRFASDHQGDDLVARGTAFRRFIETHRPADLIEPTQPPGVIRSTIREIAV